MSENTVIECNKYKFIRFPYFSGFIAFDKAKGSVGFDDVCKYIDGLEDQLTQVNKRIEVLEEALRFYKTEAERFPATGFVTNGGVAIEALAKSEELKNGPA